MKKMAWPTRVMAVVGAFGWMTIACAHLKSAAPARAEPAATSIGAGPVSKSDARQSVTLVVLNQLEEPTELEIRLDDTVLFSGTVPSHLPFPKIAATAHVDLEPKEYEAIAIDKTHGIEKHKHVLIREGTHIEVILDHGQLILGIRALPPGVVVVYM